MRRTPGLEFVLDDPHFLLALGNYYSLSAKTRSICGPLCYRNNGVSFGPSSE